MAHGPIEPERLIINATHSSLTQHADIRNIRASVPFHGDSESEMKGEQQLLANQRAARIRSRRPPEFKRAGRPNFLEKLWRFKRFFRKSKGKGQGMSVRNRHVNL